MKKRHVVIGLSIAAFLALCIWVSRLPAVLWRTDVLEMKFAGRLDGLAWGELLAGLDGTDPLEFGSTTAFTGLRGLTTGLVKLDRLEDSGPCPALWETPAGPIWGRFSDESSLEALFIEQLLLQIYQNDLVNVGEGDVVLDVGSHLGTFTKLALLNGARLVVAFEPDPTNIKCFQRSFHQEIEENRVRLVEAAVWDELGTISFSSSHDSGASTAKVTSDGNLEVAAITIDHAVEELELDRVDFIKMDIEGAERKALAGAMKVLAEHAPRMALSTYHLPDDPQVMTQLVYAARPTYQVTSTVGFGYFFEDSNPVHSGSQVRRSIVCLDRWGKAEEILESLTTCSHPRVSPDGQRMALVAGERNRDLWVVSLQEGTKTRQTFDADLDWSPVWSPDGSQLAFSAKRGEGTLNIYKTSVDGSGREERLTKSQHPQIVESWSQDGKTLAFSQLDTENGSDIWILSLDKNGEEEPFLKTPYHEGWPRFSPNGRWLSYTSNQNGYLSVYVCPFPGPGEKVQVSTREGWYPRWGSEGKELFYRAGSRVMAVPVSTDGEVFRAGKPEELFRGDYALGFHLEGGAWDVSPDGERFVMLRDRADIRNRWTLQAK